MVGHRLLHTFGGHRLVARNTERKVLHTARHDGVLRRSLVLDAGDCLGGTGGVEACVSIVCIKRALPSSAAFASGSGMGRGLSEVRTRFSVMLVAIRLRTSDL
jgi:hypothetical protein